MSRSAAILLCLLGCNVWKAVTKTLQEGNDGKEVTLKVHLSDAITHQPIAGATIEIFSNQTSSSTELSAADGNAFVKFTYQVGTLLIVTATKAGYMPNSTPWRPTRLPVFSYISLDLLPERAATLMVYEDMVQIVSGFQGFRPQPSVQFLRRALSLPADATYTSLTAFLTVAHSTWELDHFPYLQGLSGDGSGQDRTFELTPIVATSVHLVASGGRELEVSHPINVSIPLPPGSSLKENDHIPVWRFDPKRGAWIESSLGHVQKEGGQLTLRYDAAQLGYWVAAMSPGPGSSQQAIGCGEKNWGGAATPAFSPAEEIVLQRNANTPVVESVPGGPVVTKDISTYHTVFLLTILGGMAIILLFLLCLLLYYCRWRCLKPRQIHQKLQLSSVLDSSKRDQATSMSHLNLISEVHLELVSMAAEPDLHTPMLKASHDSSCHSQARDKGRGSLSELTSRATLLKDYHKSMESFPLKEPSQSYESPALNDYCRSYSTTSSKQLLAKASTGHLSTDSRGSVQEPAHSAPDMPEKSPMADRRLADYLLSRSVDHLERPTSFPRPGQLLCCSSVDQMTEGTYRKARPTLVIPAHYMKLPGEHPYAGQPLLLQTDQQSDLETIQAELSASHQPLGPQNSEPLCLSSGDPSSHGMQDPHGMEWTLHTTTMPESLSIPTSLSEAGLVQMNGEDQLLAEKTLMELRGGKPLPHPRAWFVSLDGRSNAHIRHSYIDLQRAGRNGSNDASLDSGVDMNEPKLSRRIREGLRQRTAPPTPAYTQLVYVNDEEPADSESKKPDCNPEDSSLGPLLQESRGPEEEQERQEAEEAPSPLHEEAEGGEEEEDEGKDTLLRTEHTLPQVQLPGSPPEDAPGHDDSGEDENKKSPWQKREERPLLAFNLK
ncbi:hypothetical protein AGOR_G00204120 [Albula goreensis]|uniref:Protein FAM171A1 n=1 Tax=Albula goreensis TaxID=1534307 RepID=A0A8T3CK13_9TELE|nr:hypothetical protein AGOR_G00204120 [Albula goreensis]